MNKGTVNIMRLHYIPGLTDKQLYDCTKGHIINEINWF